MAEEFIIRVVIDPRPAQKGSKKVGDELEKTEKKAKRLNSTLRRAFTVAGVALATRELGRLADEYTNIQNRLRGVTDGQRELRDVTKELFAISNRSLGSYRETAETFVRVSTATRNLGRSQEETLQFTESLNQAISLGGASAQEARAGLTQLSQGLASGALRGDELRSVLEQLPVVADVIAQSLGVTRGELRKLGSEGKITAEIILDAFSEAREELDERFNDSVPTISQAFTVLRNRVLETVGAWDQATGASAKFAQVILFIADNGDLVAAGILTVSATILTAYVPAMTAASISTASFFGLLKTGGALLTGAAAGTAAFTAVLAGAAVAANRFATEIEDLAAASLQATEAGEKFALTEFGKVGADIVRVQENLARVQGQIDREVTQQGFANPQALKLAERYRKQLESLGVAQEQLASGQAKTTVQAREYARALDELADKLDASIDTLALQNEMLGLNSQEREVQLRLAKEIARLEKGGDVKLDEEQRERLELAIRETEALEHRAGVLERIEGPQREYTRDLEAMRELLADGDITQEQFNAELDRMKLTLGQLNPELADFDAQLDGTAETQRSLAELQAILNQRFTDGKISVEEYLAALRRLDEIEDSQAGIASGLERVREGLDTVGATIEDNVVAGFGAAQDSLVGFVRAGELEFEGFFNTVLDGLAELLVQQALLSAFGGASGGGFLSLLGGGGGAASSFVGPLPAAAEGASARAGETFLVGEEGPELFQAPGAGEIIPAGQTAAMLESAATNQAPAVTVDAPVNIRNVIEGEDEAAKEGEVLNIISRNRSRVKGDLA